MTGHWLLKTQISTIDNMLFIGLGSIVVIAGLSIFGIALFDAGQFNSSIFHQTFDIILGIVACLFVVTGVYAISWGIINIDKSGYE